MVKTRQKNFRTFIFVEGEEQETIAYIDKNFGFLQSLLLIFAYPLNDNYALLLKYLENKRLKFAQSVNIEDLGLDVKTKNTEDKKSKEEDLKKIESKSVNSEMKNVATLVLHRTIRSGEEIVSEGDLTIFGRINSGAHIQSSGNLQIFGAISGNVFCDGEYMILGQVNEGNILFNGEIIDKELLKHPHNKIYRKNDAIIIEELQ